MSKEAAVVVVGTEELPDEPEGLQSTLRFLRFPLLLLLLLLLLLFPPPLQVQTPLLQFCPPEQTWLGGLGPLPASPPAG